MVNMYSMSSMGSMNTSFSGGNVFQNYKQKYGCGYEDFGTRPYAQPYPMAIVPRRPESAIQKSWLARFIKRCFIS